MTQDSFLGYLRTAMTIVGSLIVGNVIAGHAITNNVIDSVIGGGLGVAATIWGIADKTATKEMITSALSKTITFAGGLLVTTGYLKDNTLQAITGLVPLLADEINKRVHNSKDQDVITGKIALTDMKAAVNVEAKGQSISPAINAQASR